MPNWYGGGPKHSTTPYGKIPSNLLWCDRKGQAKIHLVHPPPETDDVLQEALKIENAEYHLPGIASMRLKKAI